MNFHAMLFVLTAIITGFALVGAGYVAILAFAGFFSHSKGLLTGADSPKTRFLILIPAHDEEKGIAPTLKSLRALNYPLELHRSIIIADNCTDRTASICRQLGFECWERSDTVNRGKGQALRWALDQLAQDNWDAVAIVDADTQVDSNFLAALDCSLQQGAAAIQGDYEFSLADHSYFSLLTFASKRAENALFWRPRERFGCMGFIVGNGFCLKRETLQKVPWAAYSIVEDVEYAVQLALRGVRVSYVEPAKVVSRATRNAADAGSQRLRWASGTFQVMAKYVPQLVRASVAGRSPSLLEMALALFLTSRLFLIYLFCAAATCSLVLGTAGAASYLRAGVVASGVLLCCYVAMVLSQIPDVHGSRLRALGRLPFYVCWMLFIHAAAALGIRRNAWIRTTR